MAKSTLAREKFFDHKPNKVLGIIWDPVSDKFSFNADQIQTSAEKYGDAITKDIYLALEPGFKPSKHSVLCSLNFDQSLMTWTPRRKSNKLANSKLNPIDHDAHPEAQPQEELDIVNLNSQCTQYLTVNRTRVAMLSTKVFNIIFLPVSLPSVRRRLIVYSASPLKRARLGETCETSSTRCSSLTDNNLEFNSNVDGLSFVDSEQAS